MEIEDAINDIRIEVQVEAITKFPPFRSPHEGLAIIWEEFEELKEEVFRQHDLRSRWVMQKEAKHVAAMAVRFMMDLT